MAERTINWNAFTNQAVYGRPAPFEVGRIPEIVGNLISHPFVQKIRTGVSEAAKAWWENVNPLRIAQKDTAWKAGLAVGLIESAAFTFLLPGSGMVKGGINFALTQGTFIGARYFNIPIEPQAKSFFKGVSAGGVYFSLPLGALSEIANEISGNISTPPVDLVSSPINQESVIVTPVIPEPENVIPSPVPEISETPPVRVASSGIKIEQLQNNADFKTSLAANVGARLAVEDEVIAKALAKQGKNIADLSLDALDKARMAIQHAMESQVNAAASETLHNIVTAVPEINVASEDTLNAVKAATKASFENWLDNSAGQEALESAAQKAFDEQIQTAPATFSSRMAQFMSENQANSEIFTEHTVVSGETAGHLLVKMGLPVSWDGNDWLGFAGLHQMNPGFFTDLKNATGLSQDEFDKLILKIQKGDKEAYREMINKMGLIRAGSKIRLLTFEGARRLLALKSTL